MEISAGEAGKINAMGSLDLRKEDKSNSLRAPSQFLRRAFHAAVATALVCSPMEVTAQTQTPLQLNSLSKANGAMTMSLDGLQDMDTYIIAKQTELNNDMTNYWSQEYFFTYGFTVFGNTVTIPMPCDQKGYYRIFDRNLYGGPAVSITSVQDNSTVSGNLGISVQNIDLYPTRQVELDIDGYPYGYITNGLMNFTNIDTTLLSNGPHEINVTVTSANQMPISYEDATNDDGSITVLTNYSPVLASQTLTNITTANFLAMDYAPQAITAPVDANGNIVLPNYMVMLFETTNPAICSVQISDPSGTFSRNMLVTNFQAGQIQIQWDMTDDNGNPTQVPATYVVTTTATALNASTIKRPWPLGPSPWPQNSGPAGSNSHPVTISRDIHAGYTAEFSAKLSSSMLGTETVQRNIMFTIYDAINAAAQVWPNDNDGYARNAYNTSPYSSPYEFSDNSQLPAFFAVTTNINVGHIIVVAHSTAFSFGSGSDTLITQDITGDQIGAAYGNGVGKKSLFFNIRKRYVVINGCSSGDGNYMCVMFGTPAANTDLDPRYTALQQSAFCGWSGFYFYSTVLMLTTPEEYHTFQMEQIWARPLQSSPGFPFGPGLKNASDNAFALQGNQNLVPSFIIRGSQRLTWIDSDY